MERRTARDGVAAAILTAALVGFGDAPGGGGFAAAQAAGGSTPELICTRADAAELWRRLQNTQSCQTLAAFRAACPAALESVLAATRLTSLGCDLNGAPQRAAAPAPAPQAARAAPDPTPTPEPRLAAPPRNRPPAPDPAPNIRPERPQPPARRPAGPTGALDVAWLITGQEQLRRLGLYRGAIDGIWGPLSRAAMRRFQAMIGDLPTGRLTEESLRLLAAAEPKALRRAAVSPGRSPPREAIAGARQ